MSTTTFPTDKTLPNTDAVIRQIDCQYSFGKERVSIILKFKGDATEVASLTASYREGTRVEVSDLTSKFTELSVLPSGNLEVSGKVTQSNCTTGTGCATATIAISVPYKSKMSLSLDEPDKRIIVTWAEKSTDYEFGLEVYAGEGGNGCADAGDFEGWKNEKNKNIQNYKEFKYLPEGATEPVELEGKTLELAQKFYAGIESVRRAYPEVIRTTQYFNYKADEDSVDDTLIKQISETPKLYYRDQTPAPIWKSKFAKFDWLKASYDVNCEPTEYAKLWNMTITETWLGIDTVERGTWDDNLYGADGTRWKFAVSGNQAQARADGNPVNGDGRVNPTTFQNQNNIKNLDLNNAYTAVDANSFKANPTRGLRSVSTGIPDLETITMPAVSFIGDDAFNGAANLKSINLTNNITYLGERVFQGCTSMTEAIIEPWIYDLPASTFEGCTSLDAPSGSPLKVGGLVKTIGASAFKDCTSLTSVACENAITSVGDNAFENDAALTSFSTGMDSQGTITLGDEAFKGCSHLATIDIPIATITVGTDTFANALASALKLRVPLSFLSNVPSGTTYDYAYPGYVTSIAANEFKDNTSLTGIEIPESVTTVGDNAFQNCTALTYANVNNKTVGINMFNGCSSLASFSIADDATTIGHSSFRGCSALETLELPDTITSLGHDALRLTGIKNFRVPSGISNLAYQMFYQTPALESLDFNSLTSIGADCFNGCTGLTSLTFPDTLTTLGQRAFQGCTNVTYVKGGTGLASIQASALRNMSSCTVFDFSACAAVPTLANVSAFEGTPSTKWIYIPYDLASTWLSASNWSSSTNQINASLGYRYAYADGTTTIAASAWANDAHLFEVTIPSSVTSIGADAFSGCTRLKSITFTGNTTTEVAAMTNYSWGAPTGCVIHCTDGDITIS